jgi:hypothetical protein
MAPSISSRRFSHHAKSISRMLRYGLVFMLGRASFQPFLRPDLQAFTDFRAHPEHYGDTEQPLLVAADSQADYETLQADNSSVLGTPPTPSDPNVFNLTTTRGIAAGLLIKDDNHWVVEWLAYHYHVLPLRHLVVVIDPDSKTSPREILDRWKGLMRIDIWEEEFFQKPIPTAFRQLYDNNTRLMNHRHRQVTFYVKLLRTLNKIGIPWVLLTDTDEFVSMDYRGLQKHANPLLRDMAGQFPIQTPGSILQALMHYEQMTNKTQSCLFVPRYIVGSKEANAILVERYLPASNDTNSSLNPHKFLTQRYLYQAKERMPDGKNMMHVTAVDTVKANPNVHKVSHYCPRRDGADSIESTALFKIHHYMGTLEQYSFRSDPRAETNVSLHPVTKGRNEQAYNKKGNGTTDLYTHSQGWIEGFIQQVGLAKAKELLAGVGQVGVE